MPSSITAIRACIKSASVSGSWPTLRATDGERGGRGDLIQALRGNPNSHFRMPTLCAADGDKGGRGDLYARLNNSGRQRMPTLTASMVTTADMEQAKFAGSDPRRPSYQEAAKDGGPLNPEWCEWYMGFPIGWTERGGSVTASFQRWFRLFGGYSANPTTFPSKSNAEPTHPRSNPNTLNR